MMKKENVDKFLKLLKLEKNSFVSGKQVHGNEVREVSSSQKGDSVGNLDGFVTKEKNLFLLVRIADCLPIFAFDPKINMVGIAHAGWRGTVAGIAVNLVKQFEALGADPKNILIGIGPSIEFCHYEVKEDVEKKFIEAGLEKAIMTHLSGKIYVDLKQANILQLLRSGVVKENIDVTINSCTYEDPDFFSFRKEGKELAGEMACLIGLKNGS
jgi:YfiH family protein